MKHHKETFREAYAVPFTRSVLCTLCLTLLFAVPATVQASLFGACDPCGEVVCDPCEPLENCGPKAGQWFLNGHMEAGFFANAHGKKSFYHEDEEWLGRGACVLSGNTGLLQNARLTGGQVNQVYLSAGKSTDGRRGLDIGGTIDFTWGSDAYLVQARGLEWGAGHGGHGEGRWGTGDYFAAIPQAFAEASYGQWKIIAGKFYAPFGIDDYKATNNFFYSWSPTKAIAPTLGGGALAFYRANDKLTLLGGWIMPEEIGETSKNNFVAGGFIWALSTNLTVLYVFAAGENTYAGNALAAPYELYCHSLKTTYQISKRWKNVLDWTYVDLAVGVGHLNSYSVMDELTFQYNDRWAFGTRFGFLSDNQFGTGEILDWYTVSLGANWTPNQWLTVKPELRYDWASGPYKNAFGVNTKSHQFSGGMSAVVKF